MSPSTMVFIINPIEMLMIYIVFSSLFERKRNLFITMLAGIVLFELGAGVNLIFNNTVWINLICAFIVMYVFGLIAFKTGQKQAIIYSTILTAVSVTLEFATIFAVSAITEIAVTGYKSDISLFILNALISKALFLIACLILIKLTQKKNSVVRLPGTFFIYPAGLIFTLCCFWYICSSNSLNRAGQILLSIVSACLLLMTVCLFIVYQNNVRRNLEYVQLQGENKNLLAQKAHYDILEKQNGQLTMYAHDAKNHLAAIKALNTNPEIDKYISALSDQLETYSRFAHSGNNILDIIISRYISQCETEGIEFDFEVRTCNLTNIEDIDLVAILGNLMDNALAAARESAERRVELETSIKGAFSVIVVANSCSADAATAIMMNNHSNGIYGIGLKSVNKTLKKYHGDFDLDYDEKTKRAIATVAL